MEDKRLESYEKVKKERKVLHPQTKEIIVNVVNFMKREASGDFVIPARKVQCRAAAATGFSERTVRRVMKQSRILAAAYENGGEGSSVSFPPKKVPQRPKPKTGLDPLTQCTVRKIIHRIYAREKTVPTIKNIHQKLVEEIGFKGGSRSAHKIVKELGFYWKKTKSKSFVLMEKHEIRLKRIEYLREIRSYRREGRPIVYIGEASFGNPKIVFLHAAGDRGFVPNGLLVVKTQDQAESLRQYKSWTQTVLLPALCAKSVVVLDSGALNLAIDYVPTLESSTEQMKQWLAVKSIPFTEEMLRPELHQIIKRNATRIRKQKNFMESLLTAEGHVILRIPPNHPDLNPMALLWAEVKHYNSQITDNWPHFCEQWFRGVTLDSWLARCAHVHSVEQEYLHCEGIVDSEVEKVMAKPIASKDAFDGKLQEIAAITEDDQQDNINFVRHFMGGLLGLDEHRVYS